MQNPGVVKSVVRWVMRARRKGRFLAQLARRAIQRILVHAVQLARRNFQRHAIHGHAVLANQQRIAVVKHRHDGRRALVHHDFARRPRPLEQVTRHFSTCRMWPS